MPFSLLMFDDFLMIDDDGWRLLPLVDGWTRKPVNPFSSQLK